MLRNIPFPSTWLPPLFNDHKCLCTTSIGCRGRVRNDQDAFFIACRSSFRPDPLAGRESQAIIYEWVNKKGILTFTDDLQRATKRHRASAVIVNEYRFDERSGEERARLTEIEKKFNDMEQKKRARVTLSPSPV